LKTFIPVVAVCAPIICMQINFHVAGTRRGVADRQNGVAKIRAAFDADESGVEDADNFSVQGFQRVAFKALVPPNRLKQAFGRQAVFVAQNIGRDKLGPPRGVEIFKRRKHGLNFLRRIFVKVKPPDKILNASNGGLDC
jgi:hypothetical protein